MLIMIMRTHILDVVSTFEEGGWPLCNYHLYTMNADWFCKKGEVIMT